MKSGTLMVADKPVGLIDQWTLNEGEPMAGIGDFTVNVKVKVKWSQLLKLLVYRTLKGRRTWTIQELIERDKCTPGT